MMFTCGVYTLFYALSVPIGALKFLRCKKSGSSGKQNKRADI